MFSKQAIAKFLGCATGELNAIFDQLHIPRWYRKPLTEAEARAVMAQYYSRRGRRGIAGRRTEPGGRRKF